MKTVTSPLPKSFSTDHHLMNICLRCAHTTTPLARLCDACQLSDDDGWVLAIDRDRERTWAARASAHVAASDTPLLPRRAFVADLPEITYV